MTTPSTNVFDIIPPRRPALDDVGGGAKEDDPRPGYAPNPITMLTANDVNQGEGLLERYGRVVPHTKITVHISGGAPVIFQVTSCVGGVTAIPATPFTILDSATGDFSITWPANTFPALVADHTASTTGATPGYATAEVITNGVRVRSKNSAGADTDLPCVVELN